MIMLVLVVAMVPVLVVLVLNDIDEILNTSCFEYVLDMVL